MQFQRCCCVNVACVWLWEHSTCVVYAMISWFDLSQDRSAHTTYGTSVNTLNFFSMIFTTGTMFSWELCLHLAQKWPLTWPHPSFVRTWLLHWVSYCRWTQYCAFLQLKLCTHYFIQYTFSWLKLTHWILPFQQAQTHNKLLEMWDFHGVYCHIMALSLSCIVLYAD